MKRLLILILTIAAIVNVMPANSVSAANTEVLDITDTPFLYGEFDYSDPQWITDEDFFGVWDISEEKWEKEPYLNYDKYSDLSNVEDAAKKGDYTEARKFVTQYYKHKFQSQPRAISTANDTSTVLLAKLQAYNCFYLGSAVPLDVVEFTDEPKLISADITSEVQAAAADNLKTRTFEICAIEINEFVSQIDSRESSNKPYVEAEVNGSKVIFPVVRDTYLRGGSYQNQNFGAEEVLYVSENTDYTCSEKPPIYTDTPQNPDYSDTMRARMTVDFNGLVNGDEVSAARLCFTGSTNRTEESEKAVVFLNINGDGDETGSNWTWKKANRVYTSFYGQPGALVFTGNFDQTQQHPFENYEALYKVYRYTGDETYAYHAFRLYNNYIRAYGHKAQSHTMLDLGTRAAALPEILAHLSTSVYFSEENFVPMLKYAWTLANGLVYNWDLQAETSNWGLYETAGLASIAINFKEFKDAEAELIQGGSFGNGNSGGWKNVALHRYGVLSGNLLREDKSFRETLGYAKESLTQYLKYAAISENAGEDYEYADEVKTNLADYGKYMMSVTGPNFTDFQIGDSYGYMTSFRSTLKKLADITKDPYLEWAGSYGKTGKEPNYTSIIYPDNRKAIFKTGWGDQDVYIDFTSDQSIATHNHPDDLNIVMFAYGKYLLSDQKQFSYTIGSPERVWVYSTQAHNTLSVPNITHKANISGIYEGWRDAIDGSKIYYNRTQEASPGVIHRSEVNDGYNYMEMSHANYENYIGDGGKLLANINCKRGLLLVKNSRYAIVTDYVTALDDNDCTVRQNWHMLPEANISIDDSGIAQSNFPGANIQIVPVLSQSQIEPLLLDGFYSPQNEKLDTCKYVAYEKKGKGNKVFNTLLLPTKSGSDISAESDYIKLNVDETKASAADFKIVDNSLNQKTNISYYKVHDQRYKEDRIFGDYTTDASMALIERQGEIYSQFVLEDAKTLVDTKNRKILFKSNAKIPELSVVFDADAVKLYSSKDIDLKSINIRSDKKIETVTLNDENVDFKYSDKYVYFDEEPLIKDTNEEENKTDREEHGSSGGSGGGIKGGAPGGGSSVIPGGKPSKRSDKFLPQINGHWAQQYIADLIDREIISGDENGNLNLKDNVTRAQLLTMLVKALNLTPEKFVDEFDDVSPDAWYADILSAAKSAGLISGYGGKAMPDDIVTREQLAKFLISAYNTVNGDAAIEEKDIYNDTSSISDWAKPYVLKATSLGILLGMGNGNFEPKENVLREQAFSAIGRLCENIYILKGEEK